MPDAKAHAELEIPEPKQADLMKALNFTDGDLKANREGYITKAQRRRMYMANRKSLLIAGAVVVVLTSGTYLLATSPLAVTHREVALLPLVTGLVIWAAVVSSSLSHWKQLEADLNPGQVAGVMRQGRVMRKKQRCQIMS
jgi:hypothetical protein